MVKFKPKKTPLPPALLLLILLPVWSLSGQTVPNSLLYDLSWGLFTTPLDTSFNLSAPKNDSPAGTYLFSGITLPSDGFSEDETEPFKLGVSDDLAVRPWSLYLQGEISSRGEAMEDYIEYPEDAAETVDIIGASGEDSYTWYDERQQYFYTRTNPGAQEWTVAYLMNPSIKNRDLRLGFSGNYAISRGDDDSEAYYSSNYESYTSFFYNGAGTEEEPLPLPLYHIIQIYEQPLCRQELALTFPVSFVSNTDTHGFTFLGGLYLDNRDYTYTKSWIPVDIQEPESFTARQETITDRLNSYYCGLGYDLRKEISRRAEFSSYIELELEGIFNHNLQRTRVFKSVTQDYSAMSSEGDPEVWASFRYEVEQKQITPRTFGGEYEVKVSLPLYLSLLNTLKTAFGPELLITGSTAPQDRELVTGWTRVIREDFTGDADFTDEADRITQDITTLVSEGSDLKTDITVRCELPLSVIFTPPGPDDSGSSHPLELIVSLKCWGEYELSCLSYGETTEVTTSSVVDGLGNSVQPEETTTGTESAGKNSFTDSWSFGWDYRFGGRMDLQNGNSLEIQLNTDELFKLESLSFSATLRLY